MEHTCPKCNALMKMAWMTLARPIYLQREHYKLFEQIESEISVYVCPNCGFIELYAEDYEIFKGDG